MINGSTTWSNASTNRLGGNFGLATPGKAGCSRSWTRPISLASAGVSSSLKGFVGEPPMTARELPAELPTPDAGSYSPSVSGDLLGAAWPRHSGVDGERSRLSVPSAAGPASGAVPGSRAAQVNSADIGGHVEPDQRQPGIDVQVDNVVVEFGLGKVKPDVPGILTHNTGPSALDGLPERACRISDSVQSAPPGRRYLTAGPGHDPCL